MKLQLKTGQTSTARRKKTVGVITNLIIQRLMSFLCKVLSKKKEKSSCPKVWKVTLVHIMITSVPVIQRTSHITLFLLPSYHNYMSAVVGL